MKTTPQPKNGAALIVVVLSMVAAGLVGTAILSMATSARYERVQYGITNRAYYLAESGAAYVRARRETNLFYFPQFETNALANGDRFVVTATNISFIYTNAAGVVYEAWHVIGHSTGVANPGTAFESVQQIHFDMHEKGHVPPAPGLFVNDSAFDFNVWNLQGIDRQDVMIKDTGPSDGPAVNLGVDRPEFWGYIGLNWTNIPGLNLANYWYYHYGRLSYDTQLKMQTFENVPSLHYMLGISFRLRNNGGSYGLSFFRSMTNDGARAIADADRPPWARDAVFDANFRALRGTNNYAVLWYRASSNGVFSLINSRRLLPADNLLYLYAGCFEITNYASLLLQLDEAYVGSNRENRIVAYLSRPAINPPWPNFNTTNAVWQENTTNYPAPITWDQNPYGPASGNRITNIDHRLTSDNFSTLRPPEIGVHVFYDRNAANETFFRDFALRLEGFSSPYGGTQIQW